MSRKIAAALNIIMLVVLCFVVLAAIHSCVSGTDVPRVLPGSTVMF